MRQQLIVLALKEWVLLCSEGRVSVLGGRFQPMGEETLSYGEFASLMARAPQAKVGDAYAYVIAQTVRSAGLCTDVGCWLRLRDIEFFFPLTDLERPHLINKQLAPCPIIQSAKYEAVWHIWVREQQSQRVEFAASSLLEADWRRLEWLWVLTL